MLGSMLLPQNNTFACCFRTNAGAKSDLMFVVDSLIIKCGNCYNKSINFYQLSSPWNPYQHISQWKGQPNISLIDGSVYCFYIKYFERILKVFKYLYMHFLIIWTGAQHKTIVEYDLGGNCLFVNCEFCNIDNCLSSRFPI